MREDAGGSGGLRDDKDLEDRNARLWLLDNGDATLWLMLWNLEKQDLAITMRIRADKKVTYCEKIPKQSTQH
ncbi:hypothetical protein CDL15_Pgr000549 [Punica granatum]|uniref:Uncharacterized protein n=1 Tax=Punica granatum TaxID=22663 RepID=A0A218W2M9_PUNGR|nr:hypothetical protein CDL15_Pgr000549 [Punica granatum]